MTVFPGFGGQAFMDEVLPKIRQVRNAVTERRLSIDVEVDGGVDQVTARLAAEAGANVFVSGSAVFGADRPWEAVERIRGRRRGGSRPEPAAGSQAGPN